MITVDNPLFIVIGFAILLIIIYIIMVGIGEIGKKIGFSRVLLFIHKKIREANGKGDQAP